jgi:hypothetical protein
VYLRWYGVGRLRERADRRAGENGYGDLWEGLKETFRLFREEPASEKLALSALNYHPQVLREPWGFALAAGSQRKETGSYYTPPELVRELIESALVPVMQDRLATR